VADDVGEADGPGAATRDGLDVGAVGSSVGLSVLLDSLGLGSSKADTTIVTVEPSCAH
jgi:hypothetical protein